MKLFIIIVLMGLVGLAWVWPKKPAGNVKQLVPGRPGRAKTGLKPKLARVYKRTVAA